jgi:phosphonate transport system substrate-binding protein
MKLTWTSALAVGAMLALSGCGAPSEKASQAAASVAKNQVTFSILSTESSQNLERLWRPFLADMETATGLKIIPFYASNYSGLIEAMRFNKVQIGWFSNQSGLEATRRADAEVFMRSSDPSGIDGYQAVVIVPLNSPLRTPDDLLKCDKSLDFGIGDAKSTSGTLAPMTYLFAPKGIDPNTCFKTVRAANHEANLLATANGLVDAATNNTTNIKRKERQDPGVIKKIRVIWSSPTIPEDPIVWRKDLDPAVKAKIRDFFVSYGNRGDDAQKARELQILRDLDFGVFKASDNTHLIPVREMEATEKLLQAQQTKDAGKIAEAKANLKAIENERRALAEKAGG